MGDIARKEQSISGGVYKGPLKSQGKLDPVATLFQGLLESANNLDASTIHFYLGNKANSCYFEVAGKLQKTGKKLNDKVVKELVEYIKYSANLEKSELSTAQTATLSTNSHNRVTLCLIQSPEHETSHLLLYLNDSPRARDLEDLGFWGKSLELLESALDKQKGLILVDSLDRYSLRSILNSSLKYLNQSHRLSSLSFDSSLMPDLNIQNNDRIYIKVSAESGGFIEKVLASSPRAVLFMDNLDHDTLEIAVRQAELGRLVFVVTSEGSACAALNKLLSTLPGAIRYLSLAVSASSIQTISGSNGRHALSNDIISQLESYFQIGLPESWKSIYTHAGIKSPEELLHLNFPLASEYGGVTNLIEAFKLSEDIKRILDRNPNLSTSTLQSLAIRSGMLTKREDGLIKALRKEVDLADVIEICK